MYLKKKEVAEMLRVSIRTITTYMQQGAIASPRKVGRTLLWDEEELRRSLAFSAYSEPVPETVKRGRPRKIRLG